MGDRWRTAVCKQAPAAFPDFWVIIADHRRSSQIIGDHRLQVGGKHTILGVWGGYSSSFGMKVISFGLSFTSRFQTYSFVKFWKQKLFSWFSALTFKFSETKKAYPGSSQIIANHRLLHKPPTCGLPKSDHRRSLQIIGAGACLQGKK